MINCKMVFGDEEQGIVAKIAMKMPENRRQCIGLRVLCFCITGFFWFTGLCGFLTKGMTSEIIRLYLWGALFLIIGIYIKNLQMAKLKRRLRKNVRTLQKNIPKELRNNEREYFFSEENLRAISEFGESIYDWQNIICRY